ncbi:response regulator transcription factor [Pseudoalteromonas sp. MMG013]|uniref:LytR/AlgR family response regulator transcription factor n=1 Tax=Pseudoalteromonas sp. MMG013 TaxID=2822687 RepID=UPI001B370A26|nr:LytTR family DNA-binding domain-containing protein [Pseudoalteromonas sp. MMG013]MBQ4863344.1 response regulator transcription factor [Pseudoalteromonas sp. MMG013]
MSQHTKVVIADDEPLLKAHLKLMLETVWPDVDVVGQASDGEEALAFIDEFSPDVVFLDINMPTINGLEVSRTLCDYDDPPYVVFVTAYDEYAVDAFENQAIDYLLKPIEEERLEKTVARVQNMLSSQSSSPSQKLQLSELFEELVEATKPAPKNEYLKWIKASKNNELHLIDVGDVDYFIADNKYTEVSVEEEKFLIKTSILALESELNPDVFWRIHRNCIVKVDRIQRVVKDELGHVYIDLKNTAEQLLVSRKYQSLFKQM